MPVETRLNIECADIELLEDGIVALTYKSNYEVELLDVKELEQAFISLSNNGDIYCLMNTSGRFNQFTNEAQKYLSKEAVIIKGDKLKCSAVVIDNLPYRLLARFFLNFHKPNFTMKLFSNKGEALTWLRKEMV